jgi:hypothetical protein
MTVDTYIYSTRLDIILIYKVYPITIAYLGPIKPGDNILTETSKFTVLFSGRPLQMSDTAKRKYAWKVQQPSNLMKVPAFQLRGRT